MTRSDLIDGILSLGLVAVVGAAFTFATPVQADTTRYTAPGTVLTGPKDTIRNISIDYDENGRLDGRYTVNVKTGATIRTVGRFASLGDAYAYASSVYNTNGPYSVTNYNGIESTTRPGNLRPLPSGVAGVVRQDVRDPNSPWSKHYTVTRVIREASNDDAVASFGGAKASAKASGGKSGGPAGGFGQH